MKKRPETLANALHTARFLLQKQQGPGAMTEMPRHGLDVGQVHLPDVDGKIVTQEVYDALKAHEYGHIALVERNLLPMSFMENFAAAGASDALNQSCMDMAVNSFIGVRCTHLPFPSMKMTTPKFLEAFEQIEIEDRVSAYIQHMSVLYAGYVRLSYRESENLKKQKNKMVRLCAGMEKSLKGVSELLERRCREVVSYACDRLSISTWRFSHEDYLKLCKNLLTLTGSIRESLEHQREFNEKVREEYEFEQADDMKWGDLSVEDLKMEKAMLRTWKQRHKPQYVGSMRYMHRSLTDMKVWGLKDRSIPRISVLIDASGSMHVESARIAQVLDRNPANVVACYSGSGDKGAVWVVGKDGKYADEIAIAGARTKHGYGNIVDGPALVWLAQQKGRLVWVSDGRITGAMEKENKAMYSFCKSMIEKYNIEYYRNMEDFEVGKTSEFYTPLRFRK